MEIIFLGTSGGLPTKERGLPGVAIRKDGKIVLLDCGEGSQLQLLKAGLSLLKVTHIFITHLHGDHFFGLLGLLQTCKLLNRKQDLKLYGPPGLTQFMNNMEEYIKVQRSFEINITELKGGEGIDHSLFFIKCARVLHSIYSLAYSVEEKPRPGKFRPEDAAKVGVPQGPLWKQLQMGKKVIMKDGRTILPSEVSDPPVRGVKIVYSGDTAPCTDMIKISSQADLLIHEATYSDAHLERALESQHSTATQAAETAKRAKVKKLILTHISPRYKSVNEMLSEAQGKFPNTSVAYDLLRIVI